MKYCWTTINVTDMQKSLAFYEGLLGLKPTRINIQLVENIKQ